MKRINLLATIVLLLIMSSCNEKDNPILLHYVDNNTVNITYPNADGSSISIIGGDGKYSASSNNLSVLEVELVQEQKMIVLKPQSIGEAIVTIEDESGHSYLLKVIIAYFEVRLMVDKQDVIVIGEKLTEEQKGEIQRKAILTLPINVNGGFKLVYNNEKELNKGQAFIYKEEYGTGAIEGVFEQKTIEKETNGVIRKYPVFAISIDGKQREFIMNRYFSPSSKANIKIPNALLEEVTEQFRTEYPDVESVHTQQRLK